MIEAILKPIFKPIQRVILRPLKRAKTLPKRLLAALRRFLVSALFGPLRSLDNYLRLGSYYIAKKLLAIIIILSLIIAYFGFINPPSFLNKWMGKTPQLEAATLAGSGFNGIAAVKDGDGKLLYQGALVDGLYSGEGKLFYPDGTLRYRGAFDKGLMSGDGELYAEEGALLYRGQFMNDAYNGTGALYNADGTVSYEGAFLSGKFEGAGVAYNADGSVKYAGAYVQGLYEGEGKLAGNDGKPVYEGSFVAGVYEGTGKLFDSQGNVGYEGGFASGKPSGSGKELYPSGFVKYDGEFLLGAYHGAGTLFGESGKPLYIGTFLSGAKNGIGDAYDEAGILRYSGQFADGQYQGVGSLFDADGAVAYKGFFRGGLPSGESFAGITLAKLQETLGAADPAPTAAEPLLPELPDAEDNEAPAGDEVDEGTANEAEAPINAGNTGTEPDSQAADQASVNELIGTSVNEQSTTGATMANNTAAGDEEGNGVPATDDAETKGNSASASADQEEQPITDQLLPALPATQQLTYAAMGMTFQLTADEDNPELFLVTKMATWNTLVMAPAYKRLIDAKTASVQENLPNGRTSRRFVSGNLLYTFILNKDTLVRMELQPVLEESQ